MSSHRSCCRHDHSLTGEAGSVTLRWVNLPHRPRLAAGLPPVGRRGAHGADSRQRAGAPSDRPADGVPGRAGDRGACRRGRNTRGAGRGAGAGRGRRRRGLAGQSRPAQPARVESHRAQRRRGCPSEARMRSESPRAHAAPPAPLALSRAVLELLRRHALGGRSLRRAGRDGRAGLGDLRRDRRQRRVQLPAGIPRGARRRGAPGDAPDGDHRASIRPGSEDGRHRSGARRRRRDR